MQSVEDLFSVPCPKGMLILIRRLSTCIGHSLASNVLQERALHSLKVLHSPR